MHKTTIILTTTLFVIGLLCYTRYDTITRIYGQQMYACEITDNAVILEDETGNQWEYITSQNVKPGDSFIVLLDNQDTLSVYDDEIIKVTKLQ